MSSRVVFLVVLLLACACTSNAGRPEITKEYWHPYQPLPHHGGSGGLGGWFGHGPGGDAGFDGRSGYNGGGGGYDAGHGGRKQGSRSEIGGGGEGDAAILGGEVDSIKQMP